MHKRARRRNAKSRRSTNAWRKSLRSSSYGDFFPVKTIAPLPFSPFTPAPAAPNPAIGPTCPCEGTRGGSTGIVVACQAERSQLRNRELAIKMLKAKIYELEQDKKRAEVDRQYGEKGDVAWGSQIRSYVFQPYQMVKDHRTGAETSNVQAVMDGDLDLFIQAKLRGQTADGASDRDL